MAQLSRILRSSQDGGLMFFCQGCHEPHQVKVGAGPGPRWGYNENPERPTFTPSILVTGHKIIHDEAGEWTGEWERDADGKPIPSVCHSFVTDGRIQYLGDCTHSLAGQTIELGEWPGDESGSDQ